MEKKSESETSLDLFRKLNIIFYSYLGGMFLFLILALILRTPGSHLSLLRAEYIVIEYILVAFIIAGISGAYIAYIAGTRKVTGQTTLAEKVKYFRKFSLLKLILFIFAGLCGLTGYMITATPLYLGIGFVIIMLLFLHKPTPKRLSVEFKLTQKEREIIQKGQPLED